MTKKGTGSIAVCSLEMSPILRWLIALSTARKCGSGSEAVASNTITIIAKEALVSTFFSCG
jgi:hypothetical protein